MVLQVPSTKLLAGAPLCQLAICCSWTTSRYDILSVGSFSRLFGGASAGLGGLERRLSPAWRLGGVGG